MVKLKVIGGTETEDLCLRCENFKHIQGVRESDEIRLCSRKDKTGDPILFKVASCSFFIEKEFAMQGLYRKALSLEFSKEQNAMIVGGGLFHRGKTVAQYISELNSAEAAPNTTEVVQ